ncbi:hypothetical protein [Krasilnikovia sp. MM14-A1004]|uniref:hypothetical protein n=1 Tax=Krasilnikovia sp. MM14-A1004 TaxID=3373541 RepID=UPI00399D0153
MSLDLADAPAAPAAAPPAAPAAAPPAVTDPVRALDELRAGLALAESVERGVAAATVAYREPGDPPSRPPARHRRRLQLRDLPAVADRLWRLPLGLAVALFASCGPAHALGHTDFVYYAVLIGLVLSGLAVPLGLAGLRQRTPAERAAEQVAAHPVDRGPAPPETTRPVRQVTA